MIFVLAIAWKQSVDVVAQRLEPGAERSGVVTLDDVLADDGDRNALPAERLHRAVAFGRFDVDHAITHVGKLEILLLLTAVAAPVGGEHHDAVVAGRIARIVWMQRRRIRLAQLEIAADGRDDQQDDEYAHRRRSVSSIRRRIPAIAAAPAPTAASGRCS